MRSIPKAPGIRNQIASPPTVADGPAVKNPTYKGKNKTPETTVSKVPVAGKGGPPSFSRAGGRFGKGGWQAKSRSAALNFKTPQQEAESKEKQAQMAMKKRAAKNRLTLKKGPNEKQSQLLGGE